MEANWMQNGRWLWEDEYLIFQFGNLTFVDVKDFLFFFLQQGAKSCCSTLHSTEVRSTLRRHKENNAHLHHFCMEETPPLHLSNWALEVTQKAQNTFPVPLIASQFTGIKMMISLFTYTSKVLLKSNEIQNIALLHHVHMHCNLSWSNRCHI